MNGSTTSGADIDVTAPTDRLVWTRRVVVVGLWLVTILLWRHHQTSNDLSAPAAAQQFIDTVDTAWWGIAAFVAVYLARPLVLFPASVLTVVGGVLFGPVIGVLVVVVAANSSAMIAYGVGRLLGQAPGTDDEVNQSFVSRWAAKLRANSFETVLVMRFLFLPYDLVNYAAGALRVRWAPFLAATAIGSLPGTVSFVLLGASLDRVDDGLDGVNLRALAVGLLLFVASLVVARLIRRRQTATDATTTHPAATTSPTDADPQNRALP